MTAIVRSRSWQFALPAFTTFVAAACSGSGAARSDTASAAGAVAESAAPAVMVRGAVATASPTELAIASDSGTVTVKLTQPVAVFDREPGTLADVTGNSFVGVTSVKQPDGSERATEIHVFPEALRGLGEGSHMMTGTGGGGGAASGNRMTNGAVSGGSRMTNGSASPSRMSNGRVASANGSTLVVQYAGGSQTITVPPNTKVTVIKATSKAIASGDQVVAMAQRGADGTLTTQKVLLTAK